MENLKNTIPVPSLDLNKKANNFIKKNKLYSRDVNIVFEFAKYLEQNGVEDYKEQPKIKLVEYTGAEPTCKCGQPGKLRLMHLEDKLEASEQAYISCDKCFKKTWAGAH